MLFRKKIALIVLLLVFTFGYVVFSDIADTRYTEFYFISEGNNYDTMTVNLAGGETGNVIFGLENKTTENFGVNMSFVDAVFTDDGNNLKVCLSENETDDFGQYVSMDSPGFTISAESLATGEIEMNFPAWFSGVYNGCVVYTPNTTGGNTHLNTLPRKAIFLDVNVNSMYKNFNIVVRPAFRTDGGDSYGFEDADFWFFVYRNGKWETVYNSVKNGDDKITTDGFGSGEVSILPPSDGEDYMVVFKGSGSLSIGYTGIWDTSIVEFNMFSGNNTNSMSDDFVIKYNDGSYLIMGDVAAVNSGQYDLINDADFALMNSNLTMILNPNHPDWFDFDENGVINSLEQTMVLGSYTHRGFIHLQNHVELSGFIDI